ncbi:MAG: NAD(P)/FAD-dependent oxidoreductase [Clostridia bacterium]
MSPSPRVLVIGAGVIGAAVTYYLQSAGARVTLVDRGDVGGGTSSRSDGNVLAIDKEPGYDGILALESQRLLADLAASLGPFEYRAPGSYLVLDSADELAAAESWVERERAFGLPIRFLDRKAVHDELPDLAPDVPGGLYCASDATLNPLLYTRRMVQRARAQGALIRPHTPVRLRLQGSRVTGALTENGERLDADMTVVAAGVWTPALTEPLALPVPIRPRKGTLLVGARGPLHGTAKVMEFGYLMSKFGRERTVPRDIEQYGVALVYEPTASQNFLLGSSREFVGEDVTPREPVMSLIARRALRFYPGMAQSLFIRAYAGLRPWTPDHFPLVGCVAEVPGLALAAGHEGDGIGLAAVTGRLLADLILDRKPVVDPGPLDPARFRTTP